MNDRNAYTSSEYSNDLGRENSTNIQVLQWIPSQRLLSLIIFVTNWSVGQELECGQNKWSWDLLITNSVGEDQLTELKTGFFHQKLNPKTGVLKNNKAENRLGKTNRRMKPHLNPPRPDILQE